MGLIGIALLVILWPSPQRPPVKANSDTLIKLNRETDQAISANHFDIAMGLIEKGLKLDSNWSEGLWKAGLILYQHDQFEGARSYFLRLTQTDPTRGAAWALKGMCEFQLHQFRTTTEDIGRADRLGIPSQLGLADTARLDRAIAYIELQDFGSSVEVLNKMLPGDTAEEREQLITLFGYASLQQSIYRPLTPGQAAIMHQLGEARYANANNDPSRAKTLLESLIQKYPAEPMVHYTYGSLLSSWSDYDAAKAQFRSELAINSTSFAATLALAYIGLKTNDLDGALPYALEASKMRPNAYQAHFYLGHLLVRSGQLVKGCHELETAHQLSPSSADILYILATTHRRLGRTQEAQQEFRRFQQLKQMETSATD